MKAGGYVIEPVLRAGRPSIANRAATRNPR